MAEILKMESLMGVKEEHGEVLGKFLYFSLANILIERDRLSEICEDMGLPVKPGPRLGLADAFKSATGDIYERIVDREYGALNVSKVYCRDNQKTDDSYSRELIVETLGERTNRYRKLANLEFDKETGRLGYTIDSFGSGLDVSGYCEKALELYELYKTCAGRSQIENMTECFLSQMESLKISVHGRLFFVPRKNMHMLALFEDFIEELNRNNRRGGTLTVNSMFVIDDAKQRDKMTTEFYAATRKEIEMYSEKLENIISANSKSAAVMERWVIKIQGLEAKKKHYEEILKHELNDLDEQYANLKFLADELSLRANRIRKEKCA